MEPSRRPPAPMAARDARWRFRLAPVSIVLHPGVVTARQHVSGRSTSLMRDGTVITVLTRAMFCELPCLRHISQSTTHL